MLDRYPAEIMVGLCAVTPDELMQLVLRILCILTFRQCCFAAGMKRGARQAMYGSHCCFDRIGGLEGSIQKSCFAACFIAAHAGFILVVSGNPSSLRPNRVSIVAPPFDEGADLRPAGERGAFVDVDGMDCHIARQCIHFVRWVSAHGCC
jgi:hypothetical protein